MTIDDHVRELPIGRIDVSRIVAFARRARAWCAVQLARAEAGNPFEPAIMLGVSLVGISHLLNLGQPSLMTLTLGPALGTAWSALLTFGGTVGLLGIWWRGRLATALHLEAVGLVALSTALYAVTATTFTSSTMLGGVAGPLACAVGSAAVWRALHIRAAFQRAVKEVTKDSPRRMR